MRRWGLLAALAASVVVIVAVGEGERPVAAAVSRVPAGAGAPLTFTISNDLARRLGSEEPVAPIPTGFVGASMDYCWITRYMAPGGEPVLARLLLALSPQSPVVRVGGDELGGSCSGEPPPIEIAPDAIASLADAIDAKLILGVDLVSDDSGIIPNEVQALTSAIDPRPPLRHIEAFEIGNEPDLFPQYGPWVPAAASGPDFKRYLSDFTDWAHLIRLAAGDPAVGIAGPDLGRYGLPWISGTNRGNFEAFLRTPPRPGVITFHVYPLQWWSHCPATNCPSIPTLLLNRSSRGAAQSLVRYIKRLGPGRVLRVDELNSANGGGTRGVSNTFASALWALDTLFEFARAGVAGVNFHTFSTAPYALYAGPEGGWRVFPEYYGLLTFERAAPAGSQLLAVQPGAAARADPQVKVWAADQPNGSKTVVVINKTVLPADVVLSGPGMPARQSATLTWLQAPPTGDGPECPAAYAVTGLCATSGVTLGGATFGTPSPDGGDETTTGSLPVPRHRPCSLLVRCTSQGRGAPIRLVVPPGAAVLVHGPAGPHPGPARDAARTTNR